MLICKQYFIKLHLRGFLNIIMDLISQIIHSKIDEYFFINDSTQKNLFNYVLYSFKN